MTIKMLSFRLPEDLHRRVKVKAAEEDTTISQEVRRILREFVGETEVEGEMPIADTKKVQTMINAAADELTVIRDALIRLQAVKTKFVAADPNVTGTPLEGKVAALNSALSDLQDQADLLIWTQLIAAKVDSHRGKALD